ncbi:hypothetical protein [Enterococcus gallinarum]|uniref:hypothetical protein n=1 Tax=Enterococcus gallinarum TaxID=1353 RepID=UPI0015C52577|nr:hypothetical protein [Enterococcus gallinarum]NQE01817.1 hypothetical protein [Enterococcus gallinarum]
MVVSSNGSLNLNRLAKALERLHEQRTGETVTISIRQMTSDEEKKYITDESGNEQRRDSA